MVGVVGSMAREATAPPKGPWEVHWLSPAREEPVKHRERHTTATARAEDALASGGLLALVMGPLNLIPSWLNLAKLLTSILLSLILNPPSVPGEGISISAPQERSVSNKFFVRQFCFFAGAE